MATSVKEVAGLAILFGQPKDADFLAQYWPDRSYLARGPAERLQGVFPFSVDELLGLQCSGMMASSSRNGVTESLYVSHTQALPLYRSGFTLYFHDLRSTDFQRLVAAIDQQLGLCGGRTRVSAFASSRGIGVATHYDVNDNFVIQVKGTKRWRLARDRSVVNPTVGYRVDRPAGVIQVLEAGGQLPTKIPDDHTVFDMQPGSVAYIPRGYLHQCETVDDESLHFNVQTAMLTMSDLIVYAFMCKLKPRASELRARLCYAFDQGTLSPSFQEKLEAEFQRLGDKLRDVDLAIEEASFQSFLRSVDGASMLGHE